MFYKDKASETSTEKKIADCERESKMNCEIRKEHIQVREIYSN